MKKAILYLIAAIAIVSASSCTKDEQRDIKDQSGVRVVELAFDNGGGTKVGVNDRTPQWEAGDKIWLSNGTNSEEVTLIAADITTGNVAKITTTLAGTLYAVYPASAQNGVSGEKIGFKIPTSTDGTFGNAHISVAVGTTTLTFKNVVSILKFDVGADTLINVSSSANIAGEFKVTYGETLSIEAGTNQAKSIMVSASADRDKYIAVASGVAFSAFEFTAIKTAKDWAYKKSSSATTTAVNTIYPIGKVSDWTYTKIGSLWAKFSTSASTKVRFSKGNLYCDKNDSPVKYWFEANQFDFRHYNGKENDAAVIGGTSTTTPSGTVGSFYWSKDPTIAYASKYSEDQVSDSDVFFTNETTTTPKVYFTVQGLPGVWRTLSGGDSGEWKYLLSERSVNGGTGEGNSYQRATINNDVTGIYGLIIYPDNYTSQTTATSYSSSQWTALEFAGCVFLAAAGYRQYYSLLSSVSVQRVGATGIYSSSTISEELWQYILTFNSNKVSPKDSLFVFFGSPVRLVTAAQ